MMTSILLSAVGADGVLTAKEKSFISEVMGLDDEQINTLIGMYNPAAADLVDTSVGDRIDHLQLHGQLPHNIVQNHCTDTCYDHLPHPCKDLPKIASVVKQNRHQIENRDNQSKRHICLIDRTGQTDT